jgi:D-amino peptidase
MKLYVSFDMEGITCAHYVDDVIEGRGQYAEFRRIGTREVNAAIEGALEAGVTSILVRDSHGPAKNLLPEELHPSAEYITGWVAKNQTMAGLDSTFDAVFLIGYHSKAGTPNGVLSHTYMGRQFRSVRLNGEEVGEIGLAAAMAGRVNVPIALVTGDVAAVKEAEDLLPGVQVVAVKEGLDRFTAKSLSPSESRSRIRDAARRSIDQLQSVAVYRPATPARLEIELESISMGTAVSWIPGFERNSARNVSFEHDDFEVIYNAMVVAGMVAGSPGVDNPDF